MSAETSVVMRQPRHASGPTKASTSIRVSVTTRDVLAREAAAAGISLTRYLERVAQRAEREKVFAEFRTNMLEAHKDPAFVAEVQEWDEMDDGIRFDDDWPGFDD